MSTWPSIWFIDDEKSILNSIRRIMRPLPFEVAFYNGPELALDALLQAGDVGVCVSDYRMPEKSGIQVLERVKDMFPKSNRYLLTGQGDLSKAIEAMTNKVIHGYWVKPWENHQLIENVVTALWDAWKKVWPAKILKWVLENNVPGSQPDILKKLETFLTEPAFIGATDITYGGEDPSPEQIQWINPVKGNEPESIGFTPGVEIQVVAKYLGWEEVKSQLNFLLYSAFFTVTNQKHLLDLERNSVVDLQTGLYNQAFFNQRLNENFHIAQKFNRGFFGCLIKIDLQKISKYKRTSTREAFLVQAGKVAKEKLPTNSYLSRLSALNFGGFFPEISETHIKKAIVGFYHGLKKIEPELVMTTVLFESPKEKRTVRDWAEEWRSLLNFCHQKHPDHILIKSSEHSEIITYGKKEEILNDEAGEQ